MGSDGTAAMTLVAAVTANTARNSLIGFIGCPRITLGDGRLIGSLVAVVVGPGDDHLVTGLAAGEAERQERVLRHRRAPLGRENGLAVVGRGHVLDEPRGDR